MFIRTLIDLARTFGLEAAAEYVETEEEAQILVNGGVHYMQGHAFGKPDLVVPWQAIDTDRKMSGFGIIENKKQDEEPGLIGIPVPAIG